MIPSIKRNLVGRYGENSWAVVTGGSDGIGKEFCV
jgi:17beta-estradiol 17-dehydrogenase / very-long-chain 3-oxoacyl-CoA reductase